MKNKKLVVFLILLFIAGLSIFLYPTFSNAWNKYRDSQLITEYSKTIEETDDHTLDDEWQRAEDYNETLVGLPVPNAFVEEDEQADAEYESLLNLNDDGIIGYIEIPEIDVSLPIYHYTYDRVLQKGAGHLFGSSLPVGGSSTHSIISAHRGLPSAKMFTDLNLLEKGDTFEIHVLDRTLTYEVDQIKTIKPNDTSDLGIVEGKDYVTLLTCTPYGVNTDRLIVRGHRVANKVQATDDKENEIEKKEGQNPTPAVRVLSIIIGLILGLLIFILIIRVHSKRIRHKK